MILADVFWDDIGRSARQTGLLAPAFGLMILGLASRPAWIANTLSMSFLVLLGEISYGIYLLHIPVLFWFDRFTLPGYAFSFRTLPPHDGHRIEPYLFYLSLVLALSWACYRWIEMPARIVIRNRWDAWHRARFERSKNQR